MGTVQNSSNLGGGTGRQGQARSQGTTLLTAEQAIFSWSDLQPRINARH
jgi:hypothetical protein